MHDASSAAGTVLGIPRRTARELGMAVTRLTAIGLIAIGASGLLAWAMAAIWGLSFVAGDPPGVTYTADRCRDLAEYAPDAVTCSQAAAEHHTVETVTSRAAAGVVGIGLAGASWWITRRRPRRNELLPVGFESTLGVGAFGVAAVALLALSANALLVPDGSAAGTGALLSGGLVAAPVAGAFGLSLYRALRRAHPTTR